MLRLYPFDTPENDKKKEKEDPLYRLTWLKNIIIARS